MESHTNRTKKSGNTSFLSILLDHTLAQPLYRQLYEKLRQAILTGELAGGTRLPSTREFARNLGISRTTVIVAFEQLLYEGYIRGEVGSGTYVKDVLPDDLLRTYKISSAQPGQGHLRQRSANPLSKRGTTIASTSVAPISNWQHISLHQAFHTGIPALDEFPFKLWGQLTAHHWRQPSRELFGYIDPAGYYPLRREIASYLKAARGVQCYEEQVIIVAGSQQAINLAAQLLIDPGDPVWIEEPCYLGARGALLSNGAQLIPVPVDEEGLNVSQGLTRCATARLAYVTPSHQFPLGTTMSLSRRLSLLQWAESHNAWILEDDYDGEYRYTGKPLSSLQGLDTNHRVIYMGTFSKVLFPSLRLGYLISPPDLVDAFIAARAAADRQSHTIDQLVLTDFITTEHFARHVRRMRNLYAERQHILVETARQELAGLVNIQRSPSGMHLVARLPLPISDIEATQRATQQQVAVAPLTKYFIEQPTQKGLILGYTAFNEHEIKCGIQRLALALQTIKHSH